MAERREAYEGRVLIEETEEVFVRAEFEELADNTEGVEDEEEFEGVGALRRDMLGSWGRD